MTASQTWKRRLSVPFRRDAMGVLVTSLALLIFFYLNRYFQVRLSSAAVFSGSTLLACLLVLTSLGLRRRFQGLGLGRMATWTKIHLHVGFFSVAIYALHVPSLIANGRFESLLSISFLTVALSGFYGLFATKTIPRRISKPGDPLDRVSIELDRKAIETSANDVFQKLLDLDISRGGTGDDMGASGSTSSTQDHSNGIRAVGNRSTSSMPLSAAQVLAAHYQKQLASFFQSSPRRRKVFWVTPRRRDRVIRKLKELHRYFDPTVRQYADQLAGLVRRRDRVDFVWALQTRMRIWVVIHATMSLALMIQSAVHVAIVWRWIGS